MGCALRHRRRPWSSRLVAAYAPADVRDHVLAKFESGEWGGRKTAQLLTERTGGSDLGGAGDHGEPAAEILGGSTALSGSRPNCAGRGVRSCWPKPEGAPRLHPRRRHLPGAAHPGATARATAVRVRRLKDKLGTPPRSPPAEGRVRSRRGVLAVRRAERRGRGPVRTARGLGPHDGADPTPHGLGHRVCSRSANAPPAPLVRVAVLRAARRPGVSAGALIDKPLMRRKAGRADRGRRGRAGAGVRRHRGRQIIASPRSNPPAHRGVPVHQAQGLPARESPRPSDAIEIHGGNGYIENLARGKAFCAMRRSTPSGRAPDKHPLPRRAPRPSSRTRAPRKRCLARLRDAGVGLRGRPDHAVGRRNVSRTWERGDLPPGQSSTASIGRVAEAAAVSRSRCSWATSTPARCSPSRPAWGGAKTRGADRKALVARPLRAGGISPIAGGCAASTPTPTRRWGPLRRNWPKAALQL